MLRGNLRTTLLLVFEDVLKDLPATLILRHFNFNTLAVRAFELASDEHLADSAPAALTIGLAGLLPVILCSRSIIRSRDAIQHKARDATIVLEDGPISCLLGPSGCGKTTLPRAIAGFEPIACGEILIHGGRVSTPGRTVAIKRRGASAWRSRVSV
jgi:ABC-type multidrug transport system fused ATPase/permease subunit